MPLPVSLLVLLHSLFPKLARPGVFSTFHGLMATYLQKTGRRCRHSKGWADHLLPHRIHGTRMYIDLHERLNFYGQLGGIYTSPMNPMGTCVKKSAAKCFFRSHLIRALPSVSGQPSTVGPSRAFFPLPVLESPHASNIIWAMKKQTVLKKRMKSYPVMVGTMSQTMKQVSRIPIKQPVWWKVRWSFHCSYHLVTHLWKQKKYLLASAIQSRHMVSQMLGDVMFFENA